MNGKTARSFVLVMIPVIVGIILSFRHLLSIMPSNETLLTWFSDEDGWSTYAKVIHDLIAGNESWASFVEYYYGYWFRSHLPGTGILMPATMALMMFIVPQLYLQYAFNGIFYAASLFMVWKICRLFNIDARACAIWASSYSVMLTSVAYRYGDTLEDFLFMLNFYVFVTWMKGMQENRKVYIEWTSLTTILLLLMRESAWPLIVFPTCTMLVSFLFIKNIRKIKDVLLTIFYTAFIPGVVLLFYLGITNQWQYLNAIYNLLYVEGGAGYTIPLAIGLGLLLSFGIAPIVLFTAKPKVEHLPLYVFIIVFIAKASILGTFGFVPRYLQGCVFAFALLQLYIKPKFTIPSIALNLTLGIILSIIGP